MTTFKQYTSADKSNVLIVDALNMAFRWKHKGQHDFADDFIATIASLAKSYKAGRVIVAADWGSSSYRMGIYDGYKGARKVKFAEQTESEKAEFELFFEGFTVALEQIQKETVFTLFRFHKVEADDIAAYIVTNRKALGIERIWLVSSDRDWDLLIQDNVSRFSTVSRKEFTVDNWSDHYDWTPEEYISIKCLQGDTGDSVPGIPGVGPTRALSLVRAYGSALDIAANIPLPGQQKYIKAVNDFGPDNIYRNYQLMDLITYSADAIGKENCETIQKVLNAA